MLLKPILTRSLTLAACLFALAALSPAHAERPTGGAALGGGLGTATGAPLGSGLGGRDGAGLGGGLGSGLGTGYGQDAEQHDWRARDERSEERRDRRYGLQPRGGYFCPPGQAKQGNC